MLDFKPMVVLNSEFRHDRGEFAISANTKIVQQFSDLLFRREAKRLGASVAIINCERRKNSFETNINHKGGTR
jgi:hypothetical protein